MKSLLMLTLAAAFAGAEPVPLIFDTDMGNDIDDALALAMIHALESRGECRLLAVTLTNPAPSTGKYTHLVNSFYGRGSIPVGLSPAKRKKGADHKYTDAGVNAMPKLAEGGQYQPAVPLLRRVLAQSASKVVIVQVGFSDNLSALLDSKPDDISPLDGRALIAAKVSSLSAMAGDFVSTKPEYNVRIDVPSARKVIQDWPTPVVLSGFEVGSALKYPAASIQRDFSYVPRHPVVVAYHAYQRMPYDRETWDLTSVLYAVRPESGYFDLSPAGNVAVADDGQTKFRAEANGTRRYLIIRPENVRRTIEAMTLLVSQPPAR